MRRFLKALLVGYIILGVWDILFGKKKP